MNVENIIFNKFEESGPLCRRCQKPIESGSFCEACALFMTRKDLKPEDITGTAKANRPKEKRPIEGQIIPPQYRKRASKHQHSSL